MKYLIATRTGDGLDVSCPQVYLIEGRSHINAAEKYMEMAAAAYNEAAHDKAVEDGEVIPPWVTPQLEDWDEIDTYRPDLTEFLPCTWNFKVVFEKADGTADPLEMIFCTITIVEREAEL